MVEGDWRSTAVTRYSNHRTVQKGSEGRCGAVTGGWRVNAVGWSWDEIGGDLFGNVDVYLIIKDDFLSVFQQPEEDAPALQMMTAVFICHLCHFLPFSCVLTPITFPPSRSLWLLQLKQHALLWLVKRNQVRCFCEVWSPSTSYCVGTQRHGSKGTAALWCVVCRQVFRFWFLFSSVSCFLFNKCMVIKGWWHHAPCLTVSFLPFKTCFCCKTNVDTAAIMFTFCWNSDFEYDVSKLQSKHFCFCQMCKMWQNQLQLKFICKK